MDWLFLDYWEKVKHPEAWPAVLGAGATLSTAAVVIIAAYLTYYFSRKHNKSTHNIQIEVDELKREIDAIEKIWTLLRYMSFTESDYSIIRWNEEGKKGERVRRYYYHYGNLKGFIFKELNDAFYQDKAGLHLSSEIRANIFKYRNLVAKLYFSHQNDNGKEDYLQNEISNPRLIKALQDNYNELNTMLINEREIRYNRMKI